MTTLFADLVKASELSPLFAENALRRALSRAGVAPDALTHARLQAALPEIERIIATFIPDRVESVMKKVRGLAKH